MIVALYDSGATVEDLAAASGWPEPRIRTTIRKGRNSLEAAAATFTPATPGPLHRKPTRDEHEHARALLQALRDARETCQATEITLLAVARQHLWHLSMSDLADFLDLDEDVLRTRMNTLRVGRFRSTKTTVRPLNEHEQSQLLAMKNQYRRAHQHQQQAKETLVNYLRSLTNDGITQSSLAEVLQVTRKTVSVWLRESDPKQAETPASQVEAITSDAARVIRRKYRALPRNAVGGPLWKSDKGRTLAKELWDLHQQGVPVVEVARVLNTPPSVAGKVMSMYGRATSAG